MEGRAGVTWSFKNGELFYVGGRLDTVTNFDLTTIDHARARTCARIWPLMTGNVNVFNRHPPRNADFCTEQDGNSSNLRFIPRVLK